MSAKLLGKLKDRALSTWTNLRGWKTSRRLLVIESDDWGAIRMPSRQAWERLLAAGIRVDRSRYDSLDCLENRDDFEALMNVIHAHRDTHGRPAKFTFNTVMGNPDFEAIEQSGFEAYRHQHFFHSYRHYHGDDLEPLWRKAMDSDLIRPQFHGREHLNVPLWMRDLRARRSDTLTAFSEGFYGLTTKTSSPRQVNYLAAFWAESEADLGCCQNRLKDGLDIFRRTFQFASRTFIACNYILPEQTESVLTENGIELLQGQRGQFVPSGLDTSGSIKRAFTGQRTKGGLIRTVRNVMFEPFEGGSMDHVGLAIRQIQQSFKFGRPAIISSHRVNYVSGMSRKHRDSSLKMLDALLEGVRNRWPDVEFISSDELLDEMVAS